MCKEGYGIAWSECEIFRNVLRWFGHVERKSGDDWVSACRNVEVTGVRRVGRGRKTWQRMCKG